MATYTGCQQTLTQSTWVSANSDPDAIYGFLLKQRFRKGEGKREAQLIKYIEKRKLQKSQTEWMRKCIYTLRNCFGSHSAVSVQMDAYTYYKNTMIHREKWDFRDVCNIYYHYKTRTYLTKCLIKSCTTSLIIL